MRFLVCAQDDEESPNESNRTQTLTDTFLRTISYLANFSHREPPVGTEATIAPNYLPVAEQVNPVLTTEENLPVAEPIQTTTVSEMATQQLTFLEISSYLMQQIDREYVPLARANGVSLMTEAELLPL